MIEIIFAIRDIRIPKAVIESPKVSIAFILISVMEKVVKIVTFIMCERTVSPSPIFILCQDGSDYLPD